MDSILGIQIPSTKSRLDGVISSKDVIQNEILKLLKKRPLTPTELQHHFQHKDRSRFSRDYIYPLRDSGKIIKVDGSNYFQLKKEKNTSGSVKKAIREQYAVFQTELFQNWAKRNHSKNEERKRIRFANICMGFTNPNFKIHPDNINKDNWKEVVTNIVDSILEIIKYEIIDEEPNYVDRQSIRHAVIYGLGITISKEEGIELRISGTKPKPKASNLHITAEQVEQAKQLLKKRCYDATWFLKWGVKTWTFVRPSTVYLIELENMDFYDEVVEYVEGKDGKKITDGKVIEYAKFKDEKIYSYSRRACHIEVYENKTDSHFNKFILDPDFVEPLEKFYNIRVSQRKKYLFWDNNNTKFEFKTYDNIVRNQVDKDNKFFKKILSQIGFKQSDFGSYFRANYGFRHFGIQMWLIASDYDYDWVAEMSHEDTATLKKWYGKRIRENFQRKMRGMMV